MPAPVRHIILSTAFFALMQVCVKKVAHLPTSELVFFRGIVAMTLCLGMLRYRGISPWGTKGKRKLLILRGVAGTCALFLFFLTLQSIPLAASVSIQYLSPIFTVLIASVVFKEGATAWQWAALSLALVGVGLIQGFDPSVPLLMAACGVASGIFSAIAYNIIRGIGPSEHPLVIVFYFPLVTNVIVGPFAISEWVTPSWEDWGYMLLTGLFVQVAQVYMTKAYQHDKAANIVSFKYLGAAWAVIIGWVGFGEPLGFWPGVGIALIIAAALGASWLRRPPETVRSDVACEV